MSVLRSLRNSGLSHLRRQTVAGPTLRQTRMFASEAPPSASSSDAQARTTLSDEQRSFLASALRVNQAGELAATLIYTAQTPPIVKAYPNLQPLMKHMYDQEAGHFKTFNELMAKHRIRPTAMYPVWQAAATFLGWSTGVMGREAAMACTEAVETEIGNHYNGQVRELFKWMQDLKERGETLDPELKEMIDTIKRIRDEELEHLDHAVEHDAKEAQPYEPLTNIIRYGCRGSNLDLGEDLKLHDTDGNSILEFLTGQHSKADAELASSLLLNSSFKCCQLAQLFFVVAIVQP